MGRCARLIGGEHHTPDPGFPRGRIGPVHGVPAREKPWSRLAGPLAPTAVDEDDVQVIANVARGGHGRRPSRLGEASASRSWHSFPGGKQTLVDSLVFVRQSPLNALLGGWGLTFWTSASAGRAFSSRSNSL